MAFATLVINDNLIALSRLINLSNKNDRILQELLQLKNELGENFAR